MVTKNLRWIASLALATNLAFVAPIATLAGGGKNGGRDKDGREGGGKVQKEVITASGTTTPITHLVVIFQENVSFDHYFASYPNAANDTGETPFVARPNTPSVNGLNETLLESNNNQDKNGVFYPPVRLDPTQNYTCDQNHDYTPEQQAFDSGLLDKFPEFTATPCSSSPYSDVSRLGAGIVMGYYDGNTVTGLWNYAQHFALNDNFFGTNFGPSTPGALNVVSGMTGGADPASDVNTVSSGDAIATQGQISVIGDPDPAYDDCSGSERIGMLSTNKNIGSLLSAAGISWGWFQGGFTPSSPYTPAAAGAAAVPAKCTTTTNRIDGTPETAYSPHHNPFQYYQATSNRHHLPPVSIAEVGHDGPANHIYDLSWFMTAAVAGQLPAVSYLKANRAQDGHPANSSPLDEQVFIVNILNFLQSLPDWNSTAVIITWDDSDGWYDHVAGPIVNQSNTSGSTANVKPDQISGPGLCGSGVNSLAGLQARCGYGPRIPMLVISPYAKDNFVDNTLTDQSSVVRFIEDNWNLPQIGNGSFDVIAGSVGDMFNFDRKPRTDKLILDPSTGQVTN